MAFVESSKLIKVKLDAVFKELKLSLGQIPNCYIAGGAIASIVLEQEPKDYDIWFENIEDWQEMDTAVTFSNSVAILKRSKYATTAKLLSGKEIQLVCNRLGKPEELVKTFDFLHTQSYYTKQGELFYDEDFIKRKVLVFKGNLDHPINTIERTLKFSKRGYFVPFETLQELMIEISKMGEDKIRALPKHTGSM